MEYLIFESAWINSTYCTGPPSTMIVFSNIFQTALYNYSYYFDFPLPMCGKAQIPKPTGCCYNSLSKDITVGYTSYMFNNLTGDLSLQHSAPQSANGHEYCQLSSPDGSPLYALGGYETMYFLGNSACVEGYFRCDLNNLYIFNNSDCTGFYETLPITPDQSIQQSYFLGNVTLNTVNISEGQIVPLWQTFTPLLYFYPDFSEKVDYLIALLFIVCVVSLTIASGFSIWKAIHSKHWKYAFFLSVMVVHLIRNIFNIVLTYVTIWYNQLELDVLVLLCDMMILTTIFTIYVNVILVFDQFREYNTRRNQLIAFGLVVGLHFVLNFFYYAGEIIGFTGDDNLAIRFLHWSVIPGLIWGIFGSMMLTCPPSLLMIKLKNIWKLKRHKLDSSLQNYGDKQFRKLVLAVAFLNLNVFVTIFLKIALTISDSFLRSDRDYSLLLAVGSAMDAAVCISLVFINEWMTEFAALLVFKGKSTAAKKVLDNNTESSLPPTIKSPENAEDNKIQKQYSEAFTTASLSEADKITKIK
ncbi:hypothetical protein HDV06_003756 [Boothiomyces sp. JEL0866]|nr:hypothetical protein HDV06_003756 [Boothiomyces sp. JEL0866]